MSLNKKTLARDMKNIGRASMSRKALSSSSRKGIDQDLMSSMGYKTWSPFRFEDHIDVYTPNGIIDMSEVSIPIMANGYYLPPYSGQYQMGTDKVREIPLSNYELGGAETVPVNDQQIPEQKDDSDRGYDYEEERNELVDRYKNASPLEVQELQKRLFLEGYNLGPHGVDGIFGKHTEKAYRDKLDDEALKPNIIDRYYNKHKRFDADKYTDRIVNIQIRLAQEGYLNRDQIDGKFGDVTKKALIRYNKMVEPSTYFFDDMPELIRHRQCIQGRCDIRKLDKGLSKALGIRHKKAWNVKENIEKTGGSTTVYNIYDDPRFRQVETAKDIINITDEVKADSRTTPDMYQIGDIVGIFQPDATHLGDILKSKTKNTHVGYVSGISRNGTPLITHNADGEIKTEPYTHIYVGWIERPDREALSKADYESEDNIQTPASETSSVVNEKDGGPVMVDINSIYPTQPLQKKDQALVEKIKETIRKKGLTEPIVINDDGGIEDGHHRYLAYKQMGFDMIPRMQQGGGTLLPKTRIGVRKNPDGTFSTHLMRREYIPGKGWVAFPSLFQNADSTWVDLDRQYGDNWEPIYREALRRGEVYEFGEDEQKAIEFADKGSWKKFLKKIIR